MADRVLAFDRALDTIVWGYAPVPPACDGGANSRYATAGARAMRLSQRHVLSDAEQFPGLRQVLRGGRNSRDLRCQSQRAKLANERDRFYNTNAPAEIDRHVKTSARPLFVYLQTLAAHAPYDYTYSPEVVVPGGGPGTDPTMSEYLRRLGMARIDYAYLRSELLRRFPRQAFLIVHYGDHQPTATQSLLGFGESASIEDVVASGNEAA